MKSYFAWPSVEVHLKSTGLRDFKIGDISNHCYFLSEEA